mgnify:FL=1
MILKYLNMLNKSPEKLSSTLSEFNTFYFETKPRINADIASKILLGQKKMKGLIHFCGKVDEAVDSHLTCSVGMGFLSKLLDYEHNRGNGSSSIPPSSWLLDAETFITIFAKTNAKVISELNFPSHIGCKGQRPCKVYSLKLFDIYQQKNPNLALGTMVNRAVIIKALIEISF